MPAERTITTLRTWRTRRPSCSRASISRITSNEPHEDAQRCHYNSHQQQQTPRVLILLRKNLTRKLLLQQLLLLLPTLIATTPIIADLPRREIPQLLAARKGRAAVTKMIKTQTEGHSSRVSLSRATVRRCLSHRAASPVRGQRRWEHMSENTCRRQWTSDSCDLVNIAS